MQISEIKFELRKRAARNRKTAHALHGAQAPLQLLQHLFPVVPSAGRSVVSAFWPYKSEIDTRPLLGKLASEGWTTCLPIVVELNQPLIFRRWYPGQQTVPGTWDIPQPEDDQPLLVPDVLLVPMLAFDKRGYRLGYGGGFYDRTIEKLRREKTITTIGVAYADQEVDGLPVDAFDQRLDFIMTEQGFVSIQRP